MKLMRTLEVSEQAFYDYLEQDLIKQVEAMNHQTLSALDIKEGLSYRIIDEKTNAQTEITILDYQRGHLYQTRVSNEVDTIDLRYETRPNKKGIEVTFEQHIESYETQKHWKAAKMFHELIYLGRMSDTLFDMQTKIQNASKKLSA